MSKIAHNVYRRIGGVLLLIAGVVGALFTGNQVFDKSYMATLHVLGAPGDVAQMWLLFSGFIALAVIGFSLLAVSFIKVRQPA